MEKQNRELIMRKAVPLERYKTCPEANQLEQVAGP